MAEGVKETEVLRRCYKNYYSFLDLAESPGVAHVINTASSSQLSILGAILSTWPIAVFPVLSVYISGAVAWALVAAVTQTPEYRLGLKKNAKFANVTYTTFRQVFMDLDNGLDDTEEKLKHFKRMREMLEDFYQLMYQITADLKAKHIEEFVHLRKMRNEMECDGDEKTGGNYNDLTADVQAFLRSRLGPPRSYEVGSNPGSKSFEQYFDNLDLDER